MAHAIHGFRIRSLIGRIQTALYSDSTLQDPAIRKHRIQHLSNELEEWQASRPSLMIAPNGGALSFFVTADWYETNYNYATLHLYRTQITDSKDAVPDEVFLKCLDASQRTCHCFRRQYLGKPMAYTWSALHELFLAGLTYLYCLWMSPAAQQATRPDQVSSTCTDCTMVLVILAERWSDAAPFRDIFEAFASRTMTMLYLEQHKQAPSTELNTAQDISPEGLTQWMAGISDVSMSSGVDLLLNDLIDEFSSRD